MNTKTSDLKGRNCRIRYLIAYIHVLVISIQLQSFATIENSKKKIQRPKNAKCSFYLLLNVIKYVVNQIKLKHRHTDTFNETFERFV